MMASAIVVFASGCGSTEEPSAGERPAQPPSRPQKPAGVQFRTRADTVTALHGAEHGTVGTAERPARVRYMVQIGAFRDPHHASAVQAAARSRYHMPVLNDYFSGAGLYQIRIGFFESRKGARAFLEQLKKDYPSEYSDSWIVQLKR
jgi:cell division protein FtsN